MNWKLIKVISNRLNPVTEPGNGVSICYTTNNNPYLRAYILLLIGLPHIVRLERKSVKSKMTNNRKKLKSCFQLVHHQLYLLQNKKVKFICLKTIHLMLYLPS